MAVSPAWTAACVLLTVLCVSHLGFSGVQQPTGPQGFVIDTVFYPASPDFTALYIVSDTDGNDVAVDCRHNLTGVSVVQWALITTEFNGPVRPSPGPAPEGDPESLLTDTPDAQTLWAANGSTLLFLDISPQLEGIYRCSAGGFNLNIRLTYDNPYVVAINTFLMTRLVDSLSLLVASRYADPVLLRNLAPAVGDVSVTAVSQLGSNETRELVILTASEDPNNPYQTVFEVARPEDLVAAEITVRVNVNGLTANSSTISLTVEDIYGGLMEVTVVNEGDEVVFNCTPTLSGIEPEFDTNADLFPPLNASVWRFPALLQHSGFYSCSVQFESLLEQFTTLIVYPNAVERNVTFYDTNDVASLPDAHVLLNDPRREGLNFTCVSRTGSVTLFSENSTITELYRPVEGSATFFVGSDRIEVARGERFVSVSSTARSSYGDTLTCKSDSSSDVATLRIVPGPAFIAVNGPTSAVVDYGQFFNISFVFESATGFERQLLINESVIAEAILVRDETNQQIYNFSVTALVATNGNYTLRRSAEQPSPNASFSLLINFPVLTVAQESLSVPEGGNFTLRCVSSIPGLSLAWFLPARVEVGGSNVSVFGAQPRDEGTYTCAVLEGEGLIVASTTVEVDIIITCPEEFAGGILWPRTTESKVALADCREADSRFSAFVQVLRVCSLIGWLDPNFSGCTLTSGEPQMFVILSLHYLLASGTEGQVTAETASIQSQLDAEAVRILPEYTFLSSDIFIVPGIYPLFVDGVSLDGIRLRYTVNLNSSSGEIGVIIRVDNLSLRLHCEDDIVVGPEEAPVRLNSVTFRDGLGDTAGFVRSDICECIPQPLLFVPGEPGDLLPPPREQRRKRGRSICVSRFMNILNTCNGTATAPCACTEECQCASPYVGNGGFCALDEDGDSYPAVVPEPICQGDNETSYCQLDACPSVPNSPASNSTPCLGFGTSTGFDFCVAEDDVDWGIQWPFLQAGRTVSVPCGVNYTGNSTRECGSGGVWAEPNVTNCSSRVFTSIQIRIARLVAEGDVEGTLEVFDDLAEVTSDRLFPSDVNSAIGDVADVLTLLEEDRIAFDSIENVSAIFSVLDNLLLDDNMESFEILEDVGAGQRLLDNVERYALYVAQVLQNDGGNFVANRTGENIVLRAASLSVAGLEEVYMFPEPGEIEGLVLANGSSASISLPRELLSSRGSGGNVGVASVLFRNLQAFLPNDTEATHPRSLVISSQVAERGGNGEVEQVLLRNPVTINFSFEAAEGEEISFDQINCVFWDFGGNSATQSGSQSVRWSTEGLRTVSVVQEGNTVTVTCSSNHLTSFAVLVDVGGARLESEALRIVSYIGLAISLACLLLTIIFFLTFGKKLFTAVHNFVHLNLAIALFIGYLIFAIGVELANHEKIPCNVVTALVQYFLLSAFCWMMCEGIMLYLMLVVVFTTLSKKWWFFMLLGWGIPVIFVVIGLGAVHEEYGVKDDSSNTDDYYKYCWLSSGEGTYAIWTFVAPMLAIIIINTVFLVMVLGSILKSRASRQKKVDSGYRVDVAVSVVKASLILLPLLGLTWVFGLFAVNENTAVFAWLFTIFNSLQGLFIFIFHVIRNDRVWSRLKKRYDSYSTYRASKSTASTAAKSKYLSVASSSTAGGVEMKEKQSFADPEASTEVKTGLHQEPTKEELA